MNDRMNEQASGMNLVHPLAADSSFDPSFAFAIGTRASAVVTKYQTFQRECEADPQHIINHHGYRSEMQVTIKTADTIPAFSMHLSDTSRDALEPMYVYALAEEQQEVCQTDCSMRV